MTKQDYVPRPQLCEAVALSPQEIGDHQARVIAATIGIGKGVTIGWRSPRFMRRSGSRRSSW